MFLKPPFYIRRHPGVIAAVTTFKYVNAKLLHLVKIRNFSLHPLRQAQGDAIRQVQGDAIRQVQGDAIRQVQGDAARLPTLRDGVPLDKLGVTLQLTKTALIYRRQGEPVEPV